MRRRFLIGCFVAVLLTACGAATPTTTPARATVAPPTAAPTQSAAAPTSTAAARMGDRLFVRDGNSGPDDHLSVIDATSGTRVQNLPLGVPSPDWSTLYVTERGIAQTTIRALNPQTGQALRETTITGRFTLPEGGTAGTPRGLSPDGRWLALDNYPTYAVNAANTIDTKSHLAVIDTAFAQPPKYVDLDGDFSFDAISNSGAALYLIETVPRESTATPGLGYKVRLYDLNTATLQPGVVVDKTAIAETMSGTRQSSMISPDGQWVYSLYLNQAKGPFIHMLNLNDRYAICVFLPTTGKEDLEKQLLWSLAQTRDGRTLYAVNGALGVVAEVDTAGFSVRRTVTIPTTAAERPGVVARVGNWLMPSVNAKGAVLSSGAALTPDGTILFVVAEHGLFAVNTRDLTLRGRYLSDMPLNGINLSPDGVHLYAVSEEENKLLSLDAATGGAVKEIAGATHPWGVLGVG